METSTNFLKPLIALAAVGILIAVASDANNSNKVVKQSELVQIVGVLTNQPIIETAAEGGPWVPIKLKEFPGFKFDIGGSAYLALNAKSFVLAAHIGDTVSLDILKRDLDVKIKEIRIPRLSERIINYRNIKPFSVKLHGKIYMSLKGVNDAWANDRDLGRFLIYWLGGISVIVGLVYLILHLTGAKKKIAHWFPND